ncbi:MAG: alpha/beta hydrolase, partial [Xanthomonadaceae bacterium]|nr:alpha/beta hydrolase [Xanthomonadaceae bacterium]
GAYRPRAVAFAFETALANLTAPTLGVRMLDDWFVTQASLDWLTGKLAAAPIRQTDVDRRGLNGPADHYRWMKSPQSTAAAISAWADAQVQPDACSALASSRA